MTEKKLYLIVQSVVCVLLVILLAASAISIYREGKAARLRTRWNRSILPKRQLKNSGRSLRCFRLVRPDSRGLDPGRQR